MFGEWNEWVGIYSPAFIIGAFFLYLLISTNWYRWRYHRSHKKLLRTEEEYIKLRKKKWILISLIVVLIISTVSYYYFIYNTPIKRIERLAKVSEELERKQKIVDDAMKYWESGEMQKDVKEQLRIDSEKYDNAMPWVRYGFYVVVSICGSIILFLWVRDIRKER